MAAPVLAVGKEHSRKAAKAFAYGAKWPKAVTKITEHLDVLLAFHDFPAEHWIHLRTTNPIERIFATVRFRQRVTKGPGSRAAGIAMAFKLIDSVPAPLASRERTPSGRSGPCRRTVREGQTVEKPDVQTQHHEVISKSHDTPIHRS